MEDSALRDDLVALVEESIGLLDPAAQAACELHYICAALQSLGCIRIQDLQLLLGGDLLIVQAALAPTPILFLFMLKQRALALAQQSASAAATGAAASPAAGATPAFQTPAGATGEQLAGRTVQGPFSAVPWAFLAKFWHASRSTLRAHRGTCEEPTTVAPFERERDSFLRSHAQVRPAMRRRPLPYQAQQWSPSSSARRQL